MTLTTTRKTILLLVLVLLAPWALTLLPGCAADQALLDHRAAVMNGIAEELNASGFPAGEQDRLDCLWAIENERRAAVNLADAFHWRKPTYQHPAKRPTAPTTLPWKPQDDATGNWKE